MKIKKNYESQEKTKAKTNWEEIVDPYFTYTLLLFFVTNIKVFQ